MFTFCFDASGHEKEHPYICVAGFVSSAQEWTAFSDMWKKRLNADGLEYFRASDCQNFKGPFESWEGQKERRGKLWNDLIDLIEKFAFRKLACGLEIQPFSKHISIDIKTKYRLNAFVFCARTCVAKATKWARDERITTPLEYVFEEGDEGRGLLMARFQQDCLSSPVFRPKKDSVKNGIPVPGFIPLQAADFLAYECFVTHKLYSKNVEPPDERPIHRFRTLPGTIWRYEDTSLEAMKATFKEITERHANEEERS